MPPPQCSDYREEMRLAELKRRLLSDKLSETERSALHAEIGRLERKLGLD